MSVTLDWISSNNVSVLLGLTFSTRSGPCCNTQLDIVVANRYNSTVSYLDTATALLKIK